VARLIFNKFCIFKKRELFDPPSTICYTLIPQSYSGVGRRPFNDPPTTRFLAGEANQIY